MSRAELKILQLGSNSSLMYTVCNTFWTTSYKNDHCGRRIAAVALLRRYALSSPTSSPVVHTAVLSLLQKGSVLAELYYYLQLYNNSVCAFTM